MPPGPSAPEDPGVGRNWRMPNLHPDGSYLAASQGTALWSGGCRRFPRPTLAIRDLTRA